MKKLIALDFDGVIHSYTSGWQGARVIPDKPVDGSLKFIVDVLMDSELDLAIYSIRARYWFGRKAMKNYLYKCYKAEGLYEDLCPPYLWDWIAQYAFADPWYVELDFGIKQLIKSIHWYKSKPPAWLTIDDRAINFSGYWSDEEYMFERIKNFKPWNR